ncbi:MAG: calcium/sodium antiporter [Pseudomonadales bacterium]|nr:calcium/sodium antiporter [Pseudomonadales bacterium]
MLFATIAIILGFIALIWSADRFIAGASSLAFQWGMSKLLIGLTIVAFGTSAPEILVSLFASLDGSGDLAVGNALGSNITNVGLVLGVTAFVAAIPVTSQLIKAELPILILVMAVSGFVLYDNEISLGNSLLLLAGLCLFLGYLFRQQKKGNIDESVEDDEEMAHFTGLTGKKVWLNFFGGLIILLISAQVLVTNAVVIATHFGISELIIGLTVVAVGTSLPELAASISSARHGHHEIAFGNVIGSNIFNLLVVMAIPGFISTEVIEPAVFTRDYLAMVLISGLWILLMGIALLRKKPFGKGAGALLLASYGLYYFVLYQQL